LSGEELEDYIRKTRSIARSLSRAKDEQEREELLERLLFKRADIIKDAEAKYAALEGILDEVTPLKWTIVYCSPQQIDTVMDMMNQRRIFAHRFTANEGTKPEDQYGGLSEREFLLQTFADEQYQALVAMKCLDEGVDVPPARTAILMASSGNPREYIQRIGRIIRRYPDKYEATIYDIVVIPAWDTLSPGLASAEKAIFKKELERYEEIAEVAVNNAEALKLIYEIRTSVREALNE
jgi:superfamily II DNA or RNA helicase